MVVLLERELRDYLITNVTDLVEGNTTIGMLPASTRENQVPMKVATIFNSGGETERRQRIRVMTRGTSYTEAMTLGEDVYLQLQRLHDCTLTTYVLYMVTGTKPQQSGRDESGGFLTSADYLIEFELV